MTAQGARVARRRLMALLAVLLLGGASPGTAFDDDAVSAAVKATYIYKLGPYVDWPDDAMPMAGESAVVCVVGDDGFAELLEDAVAGERLAGRPVLVSRRASGAAAGDCLVAVLAGGAAEVAADLQALDGAPVLTVTDGTHPADVRGMVNFVVVDDRVRFEIDDRAAWRSGIGFSSKVLELAISVTPRPAD